MNCKKPTNKLFVDKLCLLIPLFYNAMHPKYLLYSVICCMLFCLTIPHPAMAEALVNNTKQVQQNSDNNRQIARVTKRRRKRKRRPKRVVIDFQDELIEGSVSNPSIFHLFSKKELDYGRLIKMRKNFLPEMRRTAREIQHK